MNPRSFDESYNLGFVLAKLGKWGQALTALEQAEKLNPRSTNVHYQLAQVLRHLQEVQRSNEELKTFNTLTQQGQNKVKAAGLQTKGNQLMDAGDAKGAATAYRDALAGRPRQPTPSL